MLDTLSPLLHGDIESVSARCEFLHRDQFRARFPAAQAPLPAIFRWCEGRLVLAKLGRLVWVRGRDG
ncbi:hypothetical protein Thiowin_02449 [Thiorhodovibrio winogradskyi]|uniref:Uncharacterized protein n=1 Tax=Thiorhodovibrio winogradskyi TaxID=77007 RepID=A0ABZ0S8Q2_9GAMM|nr:hypothetical protein [Thiorhodovibrio winogradskyi]